MAKKRINKELLMVLTAGAICFAVMSFFAMFLPAVKLTLSFGSLTKEIEVLGTNAIFGEELSFELQTIFGKTEWLFNSVPFAGYVFVLVSAIFALVAFKKDGSFLNVLAIVLGVVGAVLIFSEPSSFADLNEIHSKVQVTSLIGPILGGIFAVATVGFNIGCCVIKNK